MKKHFVMASFLSLCSAAFGQTRATELGLKKCREIGKIPKTIAIDTWGVDYVLLDENKKEIFPCVSYRDKRTDGIPSSEDFPISAKRLYNRTGIQTQDFNTIIQLWWQRSTSTSPSVHS